MTRFSRRFLSCVALAAWGAPLAALSAGATLHATQLTASNLARLRAHGPDAHGGIGDWALSNGTLCAVVSDLAHESGLSTQGGVLIDVSHCGRADDHFAVLQSLMNFSREDSLSSHSIRAEADAREARIVTSGSHEGVHFETVYSVGLDRPREVRVVTTFTRVAEGERFFLLGDLALHGHRQLSPFSIETSDLARSRGFAHPALDLDNPLEMVSAMGSADLHVLVASDALDPGIAYGLYLRSATLEGPDGQRRRLARVALTGASFSLFGAFTRPLWIGDESDPGLLEMAQTLFMDLHEGETLRYERALLVGSRSDVASVSDQIWQAEPLVTGRVDDPGARLLLTRSDGAPITHVRPEPDGRFAFRLPPGSYRMQARASGGRQRVREFAVTGAALAQNDSQELGLLQLGAPARIRLPRGNPMRLVFVAEAGSPKARFGDDFRDFRIGLRHEGPSELSNNVSLAGVEDDREFVAIAPGRYRVYATRGLEYGISQQLVTVRAGETAELTLQPPARVLKSPGWVSADLHVHSGLSDDSTLDPKERIKSFYAQGADLLVTTEHDHIVDLAPLIKQMKLDAGLRSIVGVEITTVVHNAVTPYGAGHHNLFPLRHRPNEYRGGAPAAEGRRLRTLIANSRKDGVLRVFQLNHPRPREGFAEEFSDLNFFTHLSVAGTPFDPTLPLDAPANRSLSERDPDTQLRDLDFDVVELMNGPRMERYYATRADWFSLLLQGEYRPATANSDSHHLRKIVALPRNYVRLDRAFAGSSAREIDEAAFVRALRAGELYGTTGPLLDVTLGDVGIAGRFTGREGTLHIRVKAAHWVPVNEVRVYVNAALTHTLPIAGSEHRELRLSFDSDSFVTVEVEGEADEIYRAVAPGFTPFAFTNPIFVDADRDGVWSAPGLPDELPPSLTAPLQSR